MKEKKPKLYNLSVLIEKDEDGYFVSVRHGTGIKKLLYAGKNSGGTLPVYPGSDFIVP